MNLRLPSLAVRPNLRHHFRMTKLCLILAALLYGLMIVLALRPGFDLDAARIFYGGGGHFIGATRAGTILRYTFWVFPFALYGAMIVAAGLARLGLIGGRWAPKGRNLLFVTLSLAIGWGVLAQGLFKHIAHRPRPYSVTEFGGTERFRPFLRFDGTCMKSCSFPSSETATAAWVLAPASLVPPPWKGPAVAATVVYAFATAILRMAFGGHFLSDVGGAALIMILVILAIRGMPLGKRWSTKPQAIDETPPRDDASR